MDTHKNARLTSKGREAMVRAVVDGRVTKAATAREYHTTPKTVGKWVVRFLAEGVDGLRDRSSKPHSLPSQIALATADDVERLRRERRTQEHIAAELGISRASVSRILKHRGLSLLSSLEPQEPHPRYEREKPGEIIHLDIKKLGRFSSIGHRITGRRTGHCSSQGAGWEFVHVAIDDHSRIARADIFPDQKKESSVVFLFATIAYFKSLGITVERIMTDNGSCYLSKAFARACKQLGVKHIKIKPYTRRQTVRPSASSRPRSENGPTPPLSSTHSSDTARCLPGSIATTGIGRMLASHANHRSAASAWPGTTS